MSRAVHAAGPPKKFLSGGIFWCEVVVAGQDVKRLFEPRACPPPPPLRGPAAPERSDRLDPGVDTQSSAESNERKELFEAAALHLLWANLTSHWRTASRLVSSLAEMP